MPYHAYDSTSQVQAEEGASAPWSGATIAALQREPVLTAVGAFGLLGTAACAVAVIGRGSFVSPEGHLLEAAKFTFGVAIFTLTMALLLPHTGWSAAARRRWRISYCVFAIYGLALEPAQAFRGRDPRFSEAGGLLDAALGAVFGITALVLTVTFVALGLRFFRADVLTDRPLLRTGIRYGTLAVFVSFGIGIVMSASSGRHIGPDGDLMVAHMLGVHGIQAIPLVALALATSAATGRARAAAAHAAGAGWLGACVAATVQALFGRPPIEGSTAPALMLTGLLVWAVVGVAALGAFVPRRHQRRSVTAGDVVEPRG